MTTEDTHHAPLEVGIIGAGVAGLAAAIAFRRAGHHVMIYERSRLSNETGAAITLTPNANLILDRWDLDAIKAGVTPNVQARRLDGATLDVLDQQQWAHVEESYGHAVSVFHRADLHTALRELVEGKGASIVLTKVAVGLDSTSGVISFRDGSQEKKDLVVVADGIKVCTNSASRLIVFITNASHRLQC